MELGDFALTSNGHRMRKRILSLTVEYSPVKEKLEQNHERRKTIKENHEEQKCEIDPNEKN